MIPFANSDRRPALGGMMLVGALLCSPAAAQTEPSDAPAPEEATSKPPPSEKDADEAAEQGGKDEKSPEGEARRRRATGLDEQPRALDLFRQGWALRDAGDWEGSCEKFQQVLDTFRSPSALLMAAQCHEHFGRVASAWRTYVEARDLNENVTADDVDRTAYRGHATEGIARVEPRLPSVVLVLDAPKPVPPDLRFYISDQPMPGGTLGSAVAIDPGRWRITLSADGYLDATEIVTVEEGESVDLRFSLEPVPVAPPKRIVVTEMVEEPTIPAWAWVSGGLGIAFTGLAVGFLIDSQLAVAELKDNRDTFCSLAPGGGPNDYLCDADYSQEDVDADNARKNRSGGLAIGFGAAAVGALTTSIIGIVTTGGTEDDVDDGVSASACLGPTGGGAWLSVRF